MSATRALPQINRKQTRAEVDDQIPKSIPMYPYLQAALWQIFERMFGKSTLIESHALRRSSVSLQDNPETGNERLFLKVGGSRAYKDHDQEQGEHPLQQWAEGLNEVFKKYRPLEAKISHIPLRYLVIICMMFIYVAIEIMVNNIIGVFIKYTIIIIIITLYVNKQPLFTRYIYIFVNSRVHYVTNDAETQGLRKKN